MSEHFLSSGLFGSSLIPFQKALPGSVISNDSNMDRMDATLISTISHIKVFYSTATVADYPAWNFAIAGTRAAGLFFFFFSWLVYGLLYLQNI